MFFLLGFGLVFDLVLMGFDGVLVLMGLMGFDLVLVGFDLVLMWF